MDGRLPLVISPEAGHGDGHHNGEHQAMPAKMVT
jgi:hypothetical protein